MGLGVSLSLGTGLILAELFLLGKSPSADVSWLGLGT